MLFARGVIEYPPIGNTGETGRPVGHAPRFSVITREHFPGTGGPGPGLGWPCFTFPSTLPFVIPVEPKGCLIPSCV